jgi:ubiquinone/menaquinone biosynthesis C-methylase UbiE
MENQWKNIWAKKYSLNAPTHVMDGFDNLSEDEWRKLVSTFSNLIDINDDSDILDVGCGAGAFLEILNDYKTVSGIDYSENAISKIKKNINGDFKVANANIIPFSLNQFNRIICFSVFFYFPSLNYAEEVIDEMLRVCRPNSKVLIADVNDQNKKELYHNLRGIEGRNKNYLSKDNPLEHLFYKKDFFVKIAKKNNIKVKIIDEDKLNLPFYSSSNYRFTVIYTLSPEN